MHPIANENYVVLTDHGAIVEHSIRVHVDHLTLDIEEYLARFLALLKDEVVLVEAHRLELLHVV